VVGHHGFPCTGQRRTDGEVVSDFSNMCYLNSSGNPQLASNMRVWTCVRAPRRCMEDEGRPLGAGLQEQASNHLKLLWAKAMVVSVEEKVPQDGIRYESRR